MLHHGKVAVVVCNGSSTAFRACVCHFRFGPISRHFVAGQHLPRWARKGHTHGDIEGDTLGHCFALSSIFQKADRSPSMPLTASSRGSAPNNDRRAAHEPAMMK